MDLVDQLPLFTSCPETRQKLKLLAVDVRVYGLYALLTSVVRRNIMLSP